MHHYLVEHALRNVWCSPRQDNQFVVAPQRISHPRGELNVANIMGQSTALPVSRAYTHLFQVGQVDPSSIGMLQEVPHWRTRKWFKFSDAINHRNLDVMIYTANGVLLPRTGSYYMFTEEHALVFAIPEPSGYPVDLKKEAVFFRFYLNNYYSSGMNTSGFKLETGSFRPMNNNEVLTMERFLENKMNLPGSTRITLNGILLEKAILNDMNLGDHVEWTYDPSVKHILEWKLSETHQFRSILDNAYKFLLCYPGELGATIDYQDDIDIFVTHKTRFGFIRGLYLNRNKEHHHRMVTHRDYAIAAEPVMQLQDQIKTFMGLDSIEDENTIIRVIVRRGGVARPLVFDNQRIFELYKLDPQTRLRAMVGLDATVPEWYCQNLEASGYTELMRKPYRGVDVTTVEKAYGYNACSVVLGESPLKLTVSSGVPQVKLPYGLAIRSTIHEFDANGLLLGYRFHANDDNYDATNNNARLIEGVVGKPSEVLDAVYGQDMLPVPESVYSYRVYRCYISGGVPNNQWEDITDSNEYRIEDGKIRWALGGKEHWLMVRSDANVLVYNLKLKQNDGLLNLSLSEKISSNGISVLEPMSVPMGQLDIWVNRHKLIRGLDYYVKFPQVFITNKTFLKQPLATAEQDIHIRMYGLPDKEMNLDPIEDTGWVINGSLSNNKTFDLRDDKVLQINVGGKLYHRSDLVFAEQRPGQMVFSRLNGLPYQIKDTIVPMRNHTDVDTYVMRQKSIEIDQRVQDYMTEKFGEMESHEISAIQSRYPVVSPFFSHLLYLLDTDRLQIPLDRYLSDMEVRDLCAPYENLLAFDPLLPEHQPDPRFSYIVPHGYAYPMNLGFTEYRFLEAAVRIYGDGLVNLSEYVTISQ